MIKTLMKQIGIYKGASILAPLFTALEVFMEVLIPYLMASIIDQGIEAGEMGFVVRQGGLMIGVAMLSLCFGGLAGSCSAKASTGLASNLREGMYTNIQKFSFSNIDQYSTAGLVTRLTTDVTNVQNSYQMILRMFTRCPIMLVSAMAMAFSINAKLSMVFVGALIFLALCLAVIIGFAHGFFTRVFQKYDDLNASVQENVNAIRVVKAFVREEYEKEKFNKAAENLYRLFVKAEGYIALNNPLMMLTVYGCVLALSWMGANMIVAGDLTTGQLASLLAYIMNILMSLMMLSMVFVMITMSAASAKRIVQVLNEQPGLANCEEPAVQVESGAIVFDQVDFSYSNDINKLVLKNIHLEIHSGETIGIIGGTGSSKSSLVSLLSRLYDATRGRVLVGGRDVREYDMEALRQQVAVVLQKNVLFSGTILDNLRWGKADATEEECAQACRMACADEFIERFPRKYQTQVDQGGANLSGGQRQRLCIARALLKQPKILILDDSTSAVDTATDARIRKALSTAIPETTKIIIAQRISSVQDADRILVMDNGQISGFDIHERLLENNRIYREIYELQNSGGGDFDKMGGLA